jgi:hypothetical protein
MMSNKEVVMTDTIILDTIQQKVAELSPNLQRQVLSFVESLQATPRGVPGKDLMSLAGSLSNADAAAIIEAVEEGCEQIDHEW